MSAWNLEFLECQDSLCQLQHLEEQILTGLIRYYAFPINWAGTTGTICCGWSIRNIFPSIYPAVEDIHTVSHALTNLTCIADEIIPQK